jgi:hypothetical protein
VHALKLTWLIVFIMRIIRTPQSVDKMQSSCTWYIQYSYLCALRVMVQVTASVVVTSFTRSQLNTPHMICGPRLMMTGMQSFCSSKVKSTIAYFNNYVVQTPLWCVKVTSEFEHFL